MFIKIKTDRIIEIGLRDVRYLNLMEMKIFGIYQFSMERKSFVANIVAFV
jgi:hypothetical protein